MVGVGSSLVCFHARRAGCELDVWQCVCAFFIDPSLVLQ